MFRKFIILSLGLLSIQSTWSEDSLESMKNSYNLFPDEGKQDVKEKFSDAGWLIISENIEFNYYANYNYVNSTHYNQPEAWIKMVVHNDLKKDGLGVGDYKMMLIQYNCSNSTYKLIKYVEYKNKTGDMIDSYDFPSYTSANPIIPDTMGEPQLKWACFFSHIKNN